MTRVARIIRKYNWPSWTVREVKDCMLWYALHGGYIHVRSDVGDAILLARRLSDISDRVRHGHDANGGILWIEFFYQDDPVSAIHLILEAISRYQGSIDNVAFHDYFSDNPLSYRLYRPRIVLKILEYLWADKAYSKYLQQIQPRQRLSLS